MDDKIKIVLADDEVLFQKGIAFILSREDTFEIVQEVNDGEQLLHYLDSASELPDIILMDLKMPNLNGVEATRLIGNKSEYPDYCANQLQHAEFYCQHDSFGCCILSGKKYHTCRNDTDHQ